MKYDLVVRPEAEADTREACRWYEEQREGLGADFLLCVEACIESIQERPEFCRRIHKDVRRALVRRFPYGVFYTISDRIVAVLAVLHCRRNPKQWIDRYRASIQ